MSERYSRLFSLPENLYSVGAPVVIMAGALLKDNQTGKVLAQLKIQNIQDKTIKALTVKICPMDTVGRLLGKSVSYQYLDFNAAQDIYFGQKPPIVLPDTATRAFTVSVSEVIFVDNTIWSAPDVPWNPMSVTEVNMLRDAQNKRIEVAREQRERVKKEAVKNRNLYLIIGTLSAIAGIIWVWMTSYAWSEAWSIWKVFLLGWTNLLLLFGALMIISGCLPVTKRKPFTTASIVVAILGIFCFLVFMKVTYF